MILGKQCIEWKMMVPTMNKKITNKEGDKEKK